MMNDKNIKPGTLMEDTQDPPNAEMLLLLARMDRMQMEIDLLKETINVLKKDPGIRKRVPALFHENSGRYG